MKSRVVLTGLFCIVCVVAEAIAYTGKHSCEITKGWTALQTSDANQKENLAEAIYDLDADSISMGKPFSFSVKLCADCEKKPDRVTANAIMPAHQHGMNYRPEVTFDEDSHAYKVTGFLFHMPGVWEITISSYKGDIATHYTHNVTIN